MLIEVPLSEEQLCRLAVMTTTCSINQTPGRDFMSPLSPFTSHYVSKYVQNAYKSLSSQHLSRQNICLGIIPMLVLILMEQCNVNRCVGQTRLAACRKQGDTSSDGNVIIQNVLNGTFAKICSVVNNFKYPGCEISYEKKKKINKTRKNLLNIWNFKQHF